MVTVQTLVEAPLNVVWDAWTTPEHIKQWNNASSDWHTPSATLDLRNGGTFTYRMEAKDGSFGFDFGGVFDQVIPGKAIHYTIGDGRKVTVTFEDQGGETRVVETFETETQNPVEMQQQGWQAILDNFKKYAETL